MNIQIAAETDLDQVLALYRAAGYGGGVSSDDLTLVAKNEERVIGAVRLCNEEGVIVLRGMQIAAGFQRRGLGRIMLSHCEPHLDRGTSYCLPYEHLQGFYGMAGFEAVHANELPPFLAKRLTGYLASRQPVLAMRRAIV